MANDTPKLSDTPSVLAFERKLDPSDALFFAGHWDQRDHATDWPTIKLREKSVRGTISNRLKSKKDLDPAKLDAAIENPNLQTVDVATLPLNTDTLKVEFTLRVLGGTGQPSACNNLDYRRKLQDIVTGYTTTHGFSALAKRYAANLANGRFLWRNRVSAEHLEVRVAHLRDGQTVAQWTFQAHMHALRTLDAPAEARNDLEALAALIASGLAGNTHVLLQVTAFARIGARQEVFPSQEMILNRDRGEKSKTLYTVGEGDTAVAAMHSQKIGNALRTIDTWYPGAEENGPIAVEPYGSVTTQGKAYRQPKEKQDFYTLLDNWILKDEVLEADQQHFVIATLIRGGVFSNPD